MENAFNSDVSIHHTRNYRNVHCRANLCLFHRYSNHNSRAFQRIGLRSGSHTFPCSRNRRRTGGDPVSMGLQTIYSQHSLHVLAVIRLILLQRVMFDL